LAVEHEMMRSLEVTVPARFSAWLMLLVALLVAGCGGGAASKAAETGGVAHAAAPMEVAPGMPAPEAPADAPAPVAQAPMAPGLPGGRAAGQPAPPSRPDAAGSSSGVGFGGAALAEQAEREPMLVYEAHLTMAVFEATKALDKVEETARRAGGYLVRRDDTTITVRVPSKRFQTSLEEAMRLGDVLHRRVDVRDVTEEYTDLAIRLRNAEAVRKRLEELLARADNVSHALEVERELERVAGEIERMKGRLKMLGELVAFSTITVQFQARPSDRVESAVKLPFPWLERLGLSDLLRLGP
jgi:hypothetical protein